MRRSRPASALCGCGTKRTTWNADGTPGFGIPVRLGVALLSLSGEQ
ncbi:hypothetical protein [Nonomuraea sp. NPDC049480]